MPLRAALRRCALVLGWAAAVPIAFIACTLPDVPVLANTDADNPDGEPSDSDVSTDTTVEDVMDSSSNADAAVEAEADAGGEAASDSSSTMKLDATTKAGAATDAGDGAIAELDAGGDEVVDAARIEAGDDSAGGDL
jgi:hypothetical protein